MLRVGLTGGLGSGKSTVAKLLRELGAQIIEADQLGRNLMEPGQLVYDQIVLAFGPEVVAPDGHLDRARLAQIAFDNDPAHSRINQLNAIVHPTVIAAQQGWMQQVFASNPAAVAIVESALIFEVERDAKLRGEPDTVLSNWRNRFDRVILITAPDESKIARYVARLSPDKWSDQLAADARARLARQMPDSEKAARADYIIENTSNLTALQNRVSNLWTQLQALNNKFPAGELLK